MQGMTSINGLPYALVPMNAPMIEHVKVLEKALKEHPEDELRILRALVTYSSMVPEKYELCIAAADRVLELSDQDYDRAEVMVSKATVLFEQKKDLDVVENLLIAVYDMYKDYQDVYQRLVDIYLERKDFEQALLWAERALKEDGFDTIGAQLKGNVLLEMGRLEESIAVFTELTQIDSHPSEAYFGIAKCHLDKQNYEGARDACIKAFETCHYPEPLYAYGAGYTYQHLDDPYRAMKWYTKALDIDPSYPDALNNMAVISMELSNGWEEAVPYLLKAVELSNESLNPSMKVVYRNLWAYYTQILDHEKAKHYSGLVLQCMGFDSDTAGFLSDLPDD